MIILLTLYLFVYPTNYEYPRYQLALTSWEACAIQEKNPTIPVYAISLRADRRVIGGEVTATMGRTELECVKPYLPETLPGAD